MIFEDNITKMSDSDELILKRWQRDDPELFIMMERHIREVSDKKCEMKDFKKFDDIQKRGGLVMNIDQKRVFAYHIQDITIQIQKECIIYTDTDTPEYELAIPPFQVFKKDFKPLFDEENKFIKWIN